MKSAFSSSMTAMTSPNSDDGLPASPGVDPVVTDNRMGDSLKDMIAKTIAEKVRCRTQLNGGGIYASGQASPLATHNNNSYNIPLSLEPSMIPNKRRRLEPKPQGSSSSSKRQAAESLADQSGKKTRPKRGQYRKYNSQLLIEAVKAVQRGEMSVHRAGSYFGVPHSTLEYKVKERHLLRQKKPRETKAGTESNGNCNKSSAAGSPTDKAKAESEVSATSTASTSGGNVPLSPSVSLNGSMSSSECSLSRVSSQNDVKKETPSCSTSSSPEPQSRGNSPMTSPVKKEPHEETPPIPNGPSASELLMAHANEMFMAANNPAMMQLAHQAALSSLALGNPFPLLAAGWGQPNGFLPMGLPDPAMMAAAAAAAGYPGIPPTSGGNFPGVNTSASDLLKKLQQKATRHNSTDSLEPGEIPRALNPTASATSPGSPPDPTSQQVAAQ